jgi:hypothetical protein
MNDNIIDFSELSPNHKYALLRPLEKLFLHHFAKSLEANTSIVEIGTFLGGCAAIMAHANPNINITTIDQYDSYLWNPNQEQMIDSASNGTKQKRDLNLVQNINPYKNITFLHGKSPIDFANWSDTIDIYIEDGTHSGTILADNVGFWTNKLKNKGYILLHDYRIYLPIDHKLRFKDVENHANNLQKIYGYDFIGVYGDYIVLRKP